MFNFLSVAVASTGASASPLSAVLTVIFNLLFGASAIWFSLKALYLGWTWHKNGRENGMEAFSDLGISAACVAGSAAIGAAIAPGSTADFTTITAGLNDVIGNMIGSIGYYSAFFGALRLVWRKR